jgi:hypothetical protein
VPITVADYGGAQVGQGGGQDGVADDYYVQGQLTNVRGRHQLKTGLEYRTARSLVENPYRGANCDRKIPEYHQYRSGSSISCRGAASSTSASSAAPRGSVP